MHSDFGLNSLPVSRTRTQRAGLYFFECRGKTYYNKEGRLEKCRGRSPFYISRRSDSSSSTSSQNEVGSSFLNYILGVAEKTLGLNLSNSRVYLECLDRCIALATASPARTLDPNELALVNGEIY